MCVAYAQPPKVVCSSRDSPPLFVYGRANYGASSIFNKVKTCKS